MKAVIARVVRGTGFTLDEVDISGDPHLERTYGLEIPVLCIDGRKAAKVRLTEEDLRRKLA